MIVALTITRFKSQYILFAFLGMAFLRLPLWLNRRCKFWKLMGSGKNAQVDLSPDFKHWAMLTTWENRDDYNHFYQKGLPVRWFRKFGTEEFNILLKPLSSHGYWSGKQPFKTENKTISSTEKIAVITRAAVRPSRRKEFKSNIRRAADEMRKAEGFIISAGIGENPFFEQATFSVWENAEKMKAYAYKSVNHADIVKLTRERKWYKEELFARFAIIESTGSLNGQSIQ